MPKGVKPVVAGKLLPRQVLWKVGKVLSLAEQDWAMKFRIFT
jgi:hypothetical protein